MRRFYIFACISFIFSFAVASQPQFITLGSGGGFTGITTVFKVLPNGIIFKGTGVGDVKFTLCGKIKKAKAREMIKKVAEQVDTAGSFNHPGNLFYFISYTQGNNEQTLKWGDIEHPIQDDVKELYDEVLARMNGVRYKAIK